MGRLEMNKNTPDILKDLTVWLHKNTGETDIHAEKSAAAEHAAARKRAETQRSSRK